MGQTVDNKGFDVDDGIDGKPQTIRLEHLNSGKSNRRIAFIDVVDRALWCEVPTVIWFKAWNRLSKSSREGKPEAFDYVDRDNQTVLIVKTFLKEEDGGASYSVNAELKVRRLAGINSIYEALDSFTERERK